MRHFKFDIVRNGRVETTLPIVDGHSFIFIFSTSEYRKAQEIVISLYYKDDCTYGLTIRPTPDFTNAHSRDTVQYCSLYGDSYGNNYRQWPTLNSGRNNPRFGQDDENIIIRVDKTFPNSFKTYVNDELLLTAGSITLTNKNMGRVDAAGVSVDTKDALAATLTVFKYTDAEKSEAFATVMRNPETNRENELVHALDNFEETTANLEPAIMAVDAVPERRETDLRSDGVNSATLSSTPNLLPPDVDLMKLSSTMAWPRAVKLVLGYALQAEIQERHNALMTVWIAVVRGSNASSSSAYASYFEFLYSHGVVWPKAILEFTTEDNFWKIRTRHTEIISLLEDGLNALRE
ncbi:hypothetical protein GALMADRAFT_256081 [Galerina marginata CBS 339.88]|uniref:Uncharacterized protein n=1 Tax=Galerina marginata (strain CBS 339.88) TaxID=685588 RepID=A0A067SGU1_GALM3|nr:hypothetical protein GALMADRAFT_256081 [Galerina marginata CBS 339.88]